MVFFDSFHFYPAISLRVNTVFFVACIILSVSEQFTYCCEHGRGKVERAGELPWFSSLNRNTLIHLSLLSMTRKYFWQIFVQIVFHLCKGGRVGPLPQVVANRSGQLSHWKEKVNKNSVFRFLEISGNDIRMKDILGWSGRNKVLGWSTIHWSKHQVELAWKVI